MRNLLIYLVLLFSTSAFATVGSIKLMTEEYPPYNFKGSDGKPAGIAVDILVKVYEKMGKTLTLKKSK